nr:multi-epitope chimeric protein [synthetic construct]
MHHHHHHLEGSSSIQKDTDTDARSREKSISTFRSRRGTNRDDRTVANGGGGGSYAEPSQTLQTLRDAMAQEEFANSKEIPGGGGGLSESRIRRAARRLESIPTNEPRFLQGGGGGTWLRQSRLEAAAADNDLFDYRFTQVGGGGGMEVPEKTKVEIRFQTGSKISTPSTPSGGGGGSQGRLKTLQSSKLRIYDEDPNYPAGGGGGGVNEKATYKVTANQSISNNEKCLQNTGGGGGLRKVTYKIEVKNPKGFPETKYSLTDTPQGGGGGATLQPRPNQQEQTEVEPGKYRLIETQGGGGGVHEGRDNYANIPQRYAPNGPDEETLKTGDGGGGGDNRYGPDAQSRTWCRDAPYENTKRNSREKQTDIEIYRSHDSGKSFEEGDGGGGGNRGSVEDPIQKRSVQDTGGGGGNSKSTGSNPSNPRGAERWRSYSEDQGETWSKPEPVGGGGGEAKEAAEIARKAAEEALKLEKEKSGKAGGTDNTENKGFWQE